MLARLAQLREEAGRADAEFETHVIAPEAYSPEGIEQLSELGISDVIVGFRDSYQPGPDTQSLDEKIAAMHWYAEAVIAPTRG